MAKKSEKAIVEKEPEHPLPEGGFWAIVELMGHVKIAGYLTEEERFGAKMGRLEIPRADPPGYTTQFFGGSSVYRITPTTEGIARKIAIGYQPAPVHLWELSVRKALPSSFESDEAEESPF